MTNNLEGYDNNLVCVYKLQMANLFNINNSTPLYMHMVYIVLIRREGIYLTCGD